MMGHPKAVKPMANYYADMPPAKPIEEHKPTRREKFTAWALLAVMAAVELLAQWWGVRT